MNIGINISNYKPYDLQIELLNKYGVKHTFVTSDHPELDAVIDSLNSHDIVCDTLHAPYDLINDMWSTDTQKGETALSQLLSGVDNCAKHGVPIIIVHLSSGKPMPEINDVGEERFVRLFNYAKEKGVTVAIENQRFLEIFSYIVDKYDVSFCWDCGHEYGFSKGIRFMELYGDRCVALHIHDNRCGIDTDDHMIPFDGNIDFNVVAANLASKNYRGTLMLELGKPSRFYNDLSEEEYIFRSVCAAKRLNEMVENLR